MVFKKILVALDRSPLAPVVFEKALNLSQKETSDMMLFHCLIWQEQEQAVSMTGIGTLGDINYGQWKKLRHAGLQKDIEQVQTWLSSYKERANLKNVPTEIDCRIGSPGSWICERAHNWNADLIIMGRRGRKGLSELLLGSESNYVVHHANCSVLLIQGVEEATTEIK